MIPQEAGTLRDNLDPFAERTEVQCAAALAHVVGGGSGSTLFVGERQLLPIARALLRDFKVVCMDEPTSHVDAATDARVQRFVSRLPAHAHRDRAPPPHDSLLRPAGDNGRRRCAKGEDAGGAFGDRRAARGEGGRARARCRR